MSTYNDLYREIRNRFRQAGYPGANLEARELICSGSGKTRAAFARDMREDVPPETEGAIRGCVERHLRGEPVAYLIGEWDFYGLTLCVNKDVLIPRVDTEVLAGEVISYVRDTGPCRVLDLCAGSGCIGLAAAAHAPEAEVVLGEISERAVEVCRENIRRCGLSGRASVLTVDALQPPSGEAGAFQCIVCNPPYIPEAEIETLDHSVKDFEPHLALCGGADGLDFYRAVSRLWREALTEYGRLYFETGMGQAGAVLDIMRSEGFEDLRIVPDTQGIQRVVYGTRTFGRR